jgi:tetrahydromethanopterin S-methyltransferase subunit H
MFKFEKKQEVFDIYGVKIGGQPGEYPTALAGTIFYAGHNILSDENKGIFDKEKAETLLNEMDEMADLTGNPAIVQIFGSTSEALLKYIDFVSEISDSPFLIDSTAAEARIAGAGYVTEIGLSERTIYNSINMSIDDEEIEALTNSDITSSIILGFNPTSPGSDGKMDLWETGSGILDKGLLEIAEDCGIFKPLMDVAVTPLGQGGGIAIRTTLKEKSTLKRLPNITSLILGCVMRDWDSDSRKRPISWKMCSTATC